MQATLKSFKHAFDGLKDAIKSEPNLRFHFLMALLVLVAAYILKFDLKEFTILVITISYVISLELINTLIEKIVDLHSKEISEAARVIKDISAGVVLLGAISSIIIGALLFLPKIIQLIIV